MKNRRTLLNLVLFLAVAGLALLAWYKPGTKKPVEAALTTLNAAAVRDITIDRKGSDEIHLQKQAGSWQLLAPRQMPADTFLITAFLNNLSAPTISHFPVVKADLGKYGLAQPQLRLKLNDTEIDFGQTEPLEGHRYVMSGDTVYLTDGGLFYRLSHDAYWWIDKQLLPKNARITALQLPDATLTLENGKWTLAPADPDISSDAIQKLVDAWHDARALAVAEPEKAKALGEVAIQLDKGKALRFSILDNSGFLVLKRPDLNLEYRLDSSERDSLLKLQSASPAKPASGHNGGKEQSDARTPGS